MVGSVITVNLEEGMNYRLGSMDLAWKIHIRYLHIRSYPIYDLFDSDDEPRTWMMLAA